MTNPDIPQRNTDASEQQRAQVADCGPELHDFLVRDAIPSLQHILGMVDDRKPTELLRAEIHALLFRTARKV